MPSAPLFYQPIVMARVAMTKVGGSTVAEVYDQQVNFKLTQNETGYAVEAASAGAKNLMDRASGPKFQAFVNGIAKLQATQPGSQALKGFQIAVGKEDGWAANRVMSAIANHPDLLDTASPDQAAKIAEGLVDSARKEYATHPGMIASGGIIEASDGMVDVLQKHIFSDEPLTPEDATSLATQTGFALQQNVTPLPPDTTSKAQWIEDSTDNLLALWPGATARTVAALGIKTTGDEKSLEQAADAFRESYFKNDPTADSSKSMVALLNAAGMDPTSKTTYDAAFQALQGGPIESVPGAIAAALVGAYKLDPSQTPAVAGRIVETNGTPGNVSGLLSELANKGTSPKPSPTPSPTPSPKDPTPSPAPDPVPMPDPAPAPDPVPTPDPAPVPVPPDDNPKNPTPNDPGPAPGAPKPPTDPAPSHPAPTDPPTTPAPADPPKNPAPTDPAPTDPPKPPADPAPVPPSGPTKPDGDGDASSGGDQPKG